MTLRLEVAGARFGARGNNKSANLLRFERSGINSDGRYRALAIVPSAPFIARVAGIGEGVKNIKM